MHVVAYDHGAAKSKLVTSWTYFILRKLILYKLSDAQTLVFIFVDFFYVFGKKLLNFIAWV
jgi:hypothetical protein